MNILRRFVLPLGVVLAVLLSTASGAAAQGRRTSISDAELRRSGAERLHDAIAQLRPDWLLMAGDPSDAASAERVVVYLDGRHVGDLRALRGIRTADVRSVRLHGAEYVRRVDPMFPRREFVAALFVATINRAAQAPREGRVTVSLHGGLNLVGIAKSVESELEAQGYIQRSTYVGFEAFGFDEQDRAIPPAAGGSVHVGLRGALGVELAAEHTMEGWVGRVRQPDPAHAHAASARFVTWEGAVLATAERAGLRVGVGPAFRRATVTWASGFCRCTEPEESSTVAPGAAAHAVATLPARGLPVLPHVRVMARYYPSRDAPFSKLQRTPTQGGLMVSIGVGVAARFQAGRAAPRRASLPLWTLAVR